MNIEERIQNMGLFERPTEEEKSNQDFFLACLKLNKLELALECTPFITKEFLEEYAETILKLFQEYIPHELIKNKEIRDFLIEKKEYRILIKMKYSILKEITDEETIVELNRIADDEIEKGILKREYSKYRAMSIGKIELFSHNLIPYEKDIIEEYYEEIIKHQDVIQYNNDNDHLYIKCMEMGDFHIAEKMHKMTYIDHDLLSKIVKEYWDKVLEFNENGVSWIFSESRDLFQYYLENQRYDRVIQFKPFLLNNQVISTHENEILSVLGTEITEVEQFNKALFELCVKHKRYDLAIQFLVEWSDEIIHNDGDELVARLTEVNHFMRKNALLFELVIKKERYDLIKDFDESLLTVEFIEKYGEIIAANINKLSFEMKKNPLFLQSVLKSKRYELVEEFYREAITEEVLSSKEFQEYIKETKKIPYMLDIPKVLELVIIVGNFELIRDFKSDSFTNEIIDKYSNIIVQHLDRIPIFLGGNKKLLKAAIESQRFDLVHSFNIDAYTDDIIALYIEKAPADIILPYEIIRKEETIKQILKNKRYELVKNLSISKITYFQFTDELYREYPEEILTQIPFCPKFRNSRILFQYVIEHEMFDKIQEFSIKLLEEETIDKYGEELFDKILIMLKEEKHQSHTLTFNLDDFEDDWSQTLHQKNLLLILLEKGNIDFLELFDPSLFDEEIINQYYDLILKKISEREFLNEFLKDNQYLYNRIISEKKYQYLPSFASRLTTNAVIDENFESLLAFCLEHNEVIAPLCGKPYFFEKVIESGREELIPKFTNGVLTQEIIEKYYHNIINSFNQNNHEIPWAMQNINLLEKLIKEKNYEYILKLDNIAADEEFIYYIKEKYELLSEIIKIDYQAPFSRMLLDNRIFLEEFIENCSVEEVGYISMDYFITRPELRDYFPKLIEWITQYNDNIIPLELVSFDKLKQYCKDNNLDELFLNFTMLSREFRYPYKYHVTNRSIDDLIAEYAPLLQVEPEELRQKMLELSSKNEEIFTTLLPQMLTKKMDVLSIKHYYTIGMNPDLQSQILRLDTNELKIVDIIFDYIDSSEYDTCSVLYKVLNNFKYYKNLISNVNEMSEEQILNFIYVLQRKENIFNITSIEELNNNTFNERIIQTFNSFEKNIKKEENINTIKDMLLLKKYGIDLKEATFICKRYCTEEQLVMMSQLDDNIKALLIDINDIVKNQNKDELRFFYETSDIIIPDCRSRLFLEEHIRGEYAELYEKTLYKIEEHQEDLLENSRDIIKSDEVLKQLQKIKNTVNIYVIKDNFNLQIHSLGAYSGYERPSNFREDWNMPKMYSHGVCTCYIGNNQIANARAYHPILGFESMEKKDLLLLANYDISSAKANIKYSISSEIVGNFLPPNENINYTRHTHNEMVIERMRYENNKIEKKMPSYIVYLVEDSNKRENFITKKELIQEWKDLGYEERVITAIETNKDTYFINELLKNNLISEEDSQIIRKAFRYDEIVQAAKDFSIPIVIVDRLYFAKKEKEKCKNLLQVWKETKEESCLSELLLTNFNNMIGCYDFTRNHEEYTKYFNEQTFKNLFDIILKEMDSIQDISLKTRQYQVLKSEMEKEIYKRNNYRGAASQEHNNLNYYISIIEEKIKKLSEPQLGEEVDHSDSIQSEEQKTR